MPQPAPAPGLAVVRGTVAYRDRSALPPDAAVEVWITDVTPGIITTMAVVAQERFSTNGRQVPLPFELTYDPTRIDPTHRYAIKSAISSGGQLRYTGESEFRVPLGGGPATVNLIVAAAAQPGGSGDAASLSGTSWRLEDLGGAGVIDRVEATLEFAVDGRVAGRGSCNRYFGSVTITGQTIAFGQIGSTKMACPPAVADQEDKFIKALSQAQRFEIRDTMLMISYAGSEKPLRFVRTGS